MANTELTYEEDRAGGVTITFSDTMDVYLQPGFDAEQFLSEIELADTDEQVQEVMRQYNPF